MFTLLDRHFNGEVSLKGFRKLYDFSVGRFLVSLEALKRVVDKRFNGVDGCYK